nr:MAG TPA: hypothetical protein [Caudoviricetes sp.]
MMILIWFLISCLHPQRKGKATKNKNKGFPSGRQLDDFDMVSH